MAITPSAVCVGDNCVDDYLPPVDRQFIGGNAVNVAVYLRKAGIPAAYVGVVGEDAEGSLTLSKIDGQGVDVSHVRVLPGRTAASQIRLTSSRERQFIHETLGPQPVLQLDEPTLEFICRHSLVHNTMAGGTEAYLPRFQQAGGLVVSMDYGERSDPDFIARTLLYIDLAFFSMPEDQRGAAEQLARSKQSAGPRLVVVTLGRRGKHCLGWEAALPACHPGRSDRYPGRGRCIYRDLFGFLAEGRRPPGLHAGGQPDRRPHLHPFRRLGAAGKPEVPGPAARRTTTGNLMFQPSMVESIFSRQPETLGNQGLHPELPTQTIQIENKERL